MAGLLVALVLSPFLVLLGGSPATAAELCLPEPDKTGCITGTLGGRSNPIADVDVVLVSPSGEESVQTTAEDGKFSFAVTEPGDYLLSLDDETLPDGLESRPVPSNLAGPDGELVVKIKLGELKAASLEVRAEDYDEGGTGLSDRLMQGVFNGLKLGLLLALASLGLSLIYGTTGISNFAHAEQVTMGGVIAYALCNVLGMNLWLGIAVTVVLCAVTGLLQDVIMWKPLRRRGLGLTQLMIVTIGLSLALQYTFQYFIGAANVKVVVRSFGVTQLGPVPVTNLSFFAMGISIVMIAIVGFVLLRTRVGQATRAVSDNPALAAASGIDVDKIVRLVWTASAALAGLAGVLYALVVSNGIRWDTGMQILLLLFAAVTLGGLGTAFGAFVGSIIIGLVVELAGPLGAPGDLKYAVALGILILLLMVRPQGLLGRAERVG